MDSIPAVIAGKGTAVNLEANVPHGSLDFSGEAKIAGSDYAFTGPLRVESDSLKKMLGTGWGKPVAIAGRAADGAKFQRSGECAGIQDQYFKRGADAGRRVGQGACGGECGGAKCR